MRVLLDPRAPALQPRLEADKRVLLGALALFRGDTWGAAHPHMRTETYLTPGNQEAAKRRRCWAHTPTARRASPPPPGTQPSEGSEERARTCRPAQAGSRRRLRCGTLQPASAAHRHPPMARREPPHDATHLLQKPPRLSRTASCFRVPWRSRTVGYTGLRAAPPFRQISPFLTNPLTQHRRSGQFDCTTRPAHPLSTPFDPRPLRVAGSFIRASGQGRSPGAGGVCNPACCLTQSCRKPNACPYAAPGDNNPTHVPRPRSHARRAGSAPAAASNRESVRGARPALAPPARAPAHAAAQQPPHPGPRKAKPVFFRVGEPHPHIHGRKPTRLDLAAPRARRTARKGPGPRTPFARAAGTCAAAPRAGAAPNRRLFFLRVCPV
ncbi:MAG: hypothetical protein J3K34DRAFT_102593 [Monoraphidium minutum]|nr:MAG: hypothetical protein J3K34DRAFT_102593 [Monoraphidium minutum]